MNPWESIRLDDYEKHMSLESVLQLQVLDEIMGEQFLAYEADTVMILGIAGGNGLHHAGKKDFSKIYGVDINRDYLAACKKRFENLGSRFELVCEDLLEEELHLPSAELLIANLLIEYIGYDAFSRVVRRVNPKAVTCVIQINEGDSFVSDSPYLHAFDCLDEVHYPMEEEELTECMQAIRYRKVYTKESPLPNGKKLLRIDFVRQLPLV